MTIPATKAGSRTAGTTRRAEAQRVFLALDQFCADLAPGDRVPTHTELMRRFGASERMVLSALEEMRKAGRIVRRHGAGTFVTDPSRDSGGSLPSVLSQARTVVALARPDHSFFDRALELLFQHVAAADLELVCRPLLPGPDGAALAPETLGHPYGFLVFGYPLAPLARQLREGGSRVVLVGTPPFGLTLDIPCVYGAQDYGGYLAAQHLLSLGHRRIAFAHAGNGLSQSLRWQGCLRAVREAERGGLAVDLTVLSLEETEVWRGDPDRAAAWVRRPEAPTGVVVWNDHEAVYLLLSLTRAGVRIPEELSLVGYDALPEGELVSPALTTVDPFIDQMLHIALSLLPQSDSPSVIHTSTVVPALVVRESTAPPPP